MRAAERLSAGDAQDVPARRSRDTFPLDWDPSLLDNSPKARGVPPRPALSAALVAAAAAWAGVLASGSAWLANAAGATWLGGDPRLVLLVCFVAGFAGVLAALSFVVSACDDTPAARAAGCVRAFVALALAGALFGSLSGSLGVSATLATGEAVARSPVSSYEFTVDSDPRLSSTGSWTFDAVVSGGGADGAAVRMEIPQNAGGTEESEASSEPPVSLGEVLTAVGRWKALDPSSEYDSSLIRGGVSARVSVRVFERTGVQGGLVGAVRTFRRGLVALIDPYGGDARALTAGVVCGMQASLAGTDANDDFTVLGLSHLVAVSGSHLAVVASLAGTFARRARFRPGARLVVMAALLGVYIVFTGVQASAVRSWVMTVAALAAAVAGRRAHAVSSVAVAALVMLVADPSCASNMGFQLSVLSVVGISVFSGLFGAWTECLFWGRAPRFVVDGVSLTLVAQLFTAPVCLPAFGRLALLSPLANVLVGPVVSLLLVVGLLCSALAMALPGAASVILLPCDALAGASCLVSGILADVPHAQAALVVSAPAAFVALAAVAVLLYAFWPSPSRAVLYAVLGAGLAVLASCTVAWRFLAPCRIVVLDVGQGDAVLVQDGASALLVDTGPDDAVVYALARNHVVHLDAVLLTHTDSDHAGGLDDLLGFVEVDRVIVARGVAGSVTSSDASLAATLSETGALVEVAAGDALTVGAFELEVVWPREEVDGCDNEDSIVAVARAGDPSGEGVSLSALLTGDAEREVVWPLVASGATGTVDVLKVGHHGSAVSTTPEMVSALEAAVCVASAGEGNSYGHPSRECVEAAEEGGALFLCTKDRGDIELRPARGGVEVACEREAA